MVVVLVVLFVAAGLWAYLEFTHPLPTPDAAPAPDPAPARGPARAPTPPHAGDVLLCATNGHATTDWCTTDDGRRVCTRCGRPVDRRALYDQNPVVVELERIWDAS